MAKRALVDAVSLRLLLMEGAGKLELILLFEIKIE
jgi:hypothetical protein